MPTNAIKEDGRLCCPICSNRQVLVGVNDMWTTSPDLAKYLANPDDGYKYTKSSNKIIQWTCPECKHSFLKTPNKMSFSKIKCQYCNLERSYSEKFVTSFLDQCGVDFYREKKFVWSQNKRYDFFVPCYQLIIETCDVYSLKHLAINGNDLIELGYNGKQIGKILNELLDLVMRDRVKNIRAELIQIIKDGKLNAGI